MITKKFTPKRTTCKVTFSLPASAATTSVAVVGDFNNWDPTKDVMKLKGKAYSATVTLKPNTDYKFKYFIDGAKWENDDAADAFVTNEFGTEDSLLKIGE